MSPQNLKCLQFSDFELIIGRGQTDGRTGGVQRISPQYKYTYNTPARVVNR